jgi:hypothetical protein
VICASSTCLYKRALLIALKFIKFSFPIVHHNKDTGKL